jgi:hypothetical protein
MFPDLRRGGGFNFFLSDGLHALAGRRVDSGQAVNRAGHRAGRPLIDCAWVAGQDAEPESRPQRFQQDFGTQFGFSPGPA